MANDYLLKTWREIAYNQEQTQEQYNQFWGAYFVQEKEVYKDILGHPDVVVKGTVEELAKKYNMEVLTMVGFLDGINERFPRPLLPCSVSSSFITIGNRVVAFKPAKMIDSETIV